MTSNLLIKDKSETGKHIKIAPFKKAIRKTEPHKHNNYFEIIYLSKGSGTHSIDHNSFEIRPPVVFFVRKEQVHHWELLTEPEGFVLIIKKSFVERSLDDELKSLLTRVSKLHLLQINETNTIDALFQLLTSENGNNFPVVEGLLKALLAKIFEVTLPIALKANTHSGIFQSYLELLGQTAELKNHVGHYAKLLNTTPQNLNMVCRKATNQSSSGILAEHIIGEAKRQLIYSNNTVSEISFSLAFKDPSHFVKYFKRHSGLTPQAFRCQ